jgi:protein tyrosine kinase modulator
MRTLIKVETVRGDAFSVSYVAEDPRTAQAITERLASLFIEENVRDRENLAIGTSEFLETQLDDARRRLVEQEKKLEEYRLRFAGQLPSQAAANLQGVQSARMQLQALDEVLSRARERQVTLERDLNDQLNAASLTPLAGAGSANPDAAATLPEQLQNARTRLAALEARLTPEHPDVTRLKRDIQQLEAKLAADPGAAAPPPAAPRDASQIARDRRIRDLRADLTSVARDIAARQADEERIRAEVTAYQSRLNAAPIREAEMTELMRDYDTIQQIYRSLLAKREDSKVAANLEQRQVGEQFRVLDPARVAERPFSPDRMKLDLMGIGLGLLLGLAWAGLLEYYDTSLKTEDDIRTVIMLPVIATIPLLQEATPPRKSRPWLRWSVTAGAAALVVVIATLVWTLRG